MIGMDDLSDDEWIDEVYYYFRNIWELLEKERVVVVIGKGGEIMMILVSILMFLSVVMIEKGDEEKFGFLFVLLVR